MEYPQRCVGCGTCVTVCDSGALSQDAPDAPLRYDRDRCTGCGACAAVCVREARVHVGRNVTVAQVMDEIDREVIFHDQSGGGVTFSGGEPLAQPAFLLALLEASKERDLHTVVDTCGHAPQEILERVSGLVDLFLYDVKMMDPERHRAMTVVPNERILANLAWLSERGRNVIVRFPLVGGLNDDDENCRALGAWLAALPAPFPVDILPYHRIGLEKYGRLGRTYELGEAQTPTREDLRRVAGTLRAARLRVTMNGGPVPE